MLSDVLRIAERGVAGHWLNPESKCPVSSNWSTAPVQTADELEDSFRDGFNFGIRTGRPSQVANGRYLYAIDIDVKGDEADADEAFAWLDANIPGWESLPYVRSGRAGHNQHIYCVCDQDLASRKLAHSSKKVTRSSKDGRKIQSWAWEIELFGTGKQVVAPPSIHPDTGNAYKWGKRIDFNNLEAIYVDLSKIARSSDGDREESARSSTRNDSSRDLRDAAARKPLGLSRKKMKRILDALPTEWAFDRNLWLKVGMAIHHETGGSEVGLRLWHWFSEIDDKYHEGEGPAGLDYRWERFRGGDFCNLRPITFRTLIKHSEAVSVADDHAEGDDEVDAAIKRLNGMHALIRNSGKTLILNEEHDGRLTWSRDRDFLTWYADDKIDVWDKPNAKGQSRLISKSIASIWLTHPGKRKYEGVTMAPDGNCGRAYNLWRGFSVEADEYASCELFLDHIFDNVCDGDVDLYNWVIGWMAHMIQKPWEKPGVALVFKGKRGVGKTIVGEVLCELLAKHTIKVSNAKHLTGNFNAHLAHAILVRVEEAFWVGDRAGANVLKDMITGPTIRIEQKGVDSGEIPSFHRFLFTSNEQWVVPAGMEERRFAVLEVADHHIQDRPYFGKIIAELKNGGYGALLHFLKTRDLKGIDVGTAPITAALAQQKLASLTGIEAWWVECLIEGQPPASRLMFNDEGDDWTETSLTLATSEIRESYERRLRNRKYEGDPIGASLFTKRLKEMCPTIQETRPRKGQSRTYALVLPPLPECRLQFEKHFGQRIFGSTAD